MVWHLYLGTNAKESHYTALVSSHDNVYHGSVNAQLPSGRLCPNQLSCSYSDVRSSLFGPFFFTLYSLPILPIWRFSLYLPFFRYLHYASPVMWARPFITSGQLIQFVIVISIHVFGFLHPDTCFNMQPVIYEWWDLLFWFPTLIFSFFFSFYFQLAHSLIHSLFTLLNYLFYLWCTVLILEVVLFHCGFWILRDVLFVFRWRIPSDEKQEENG